MSRTVMWEGRIDRFMVRLLSKGHIQTMPAKLEIAESKDGMGNWRWEDLRTDVLTLMPRDRFEALWKEQAERLPEVPE